MTTKPEPREYTAEEVRDKFLLYVQHLVTYWETLEGDDSVRDRMNGLVHSIFTTLDGCSVGLPGFVVAPAPHESDAEYHRDNGENWYPEAPDAPGDIAGSLHEYWSAYR